jgi:hypothetical protein
MMDIRFEVLLSRVRRDSHGIGRHGVQVAIRR